MTMADALPDILRAEADAAEALPLDYLRVSVTDRCQLNCVYCRPTGAPPTGGLTVLPLDELVACCAAICEVAPVRKIRLSGGEPLLRPDLPELIAALVALPACPEVTLTTNGVLLAERAAELAAAGLSRLNVSLDTADAACFLRLTSEDALAQVLRGLDAARAAGFEGTKLNAVLMSSLGPEQIAPLLRVAAEHEAMLRLIELMPLGMEPAVYEAAFVTADEGWRRVAAALGRPLEAVPAGAAGHPRFAATLADGRRVTVEMIAPMSRPFCADCRRLRLSCDGQIVPCLLSPVRVPLRNEAGKLPDPTALRSLLRQVVGLKCRASDATLSGMWAIGG